jgi:DNA invertase Pin-like site-specific DNA recombinase
MARHLIGYIQVSTGKQGRSALGLAAQREAITRFAHVEGFSLGRAFTEVEEKADIAERDPDVG